MNYYAILTCGVLSIVLGFIWYGPLFGKKWMEFYGPKDATPEMMKQMQKQIMPLYFVQFLLSLFQVYVLAWFIPSLSDVSSGVHTAFGIFVGFILPIIAGSALWIGDNYRVMRQKVAIQAGYQLVFMLLSGYILSIWK